MKKIIRIQGLVKLTNRVRQTISQPMSSDQLEQWKDSVAEAVNHIDGVLAQHQCALNALPRPSRNAYRFLKNLDFDAITPDENAWSDAKNVRSISFPRLQSYLRGRLDALTTMAGDDEAALIYQSICETYEHIEEDLRRGGIRPRELTAPSREMRSWFWLL